MQLETGKIIAIRTTKGRGGLFGAPTNNSPSTSSSGPGKYLLFVCNFCFNSSCSLEGSTKPESDGDDDDCILVSDNAPESQKTTTTSENIPPTTSTVTTASGSETATKTTDKNCVPATTAASDKTYNTQRQMQPQTAPNDPQQSHLKKSMPNIRNIPAPYPSINYQAQQKEGNLFSDFLMSFCPVFSGKETVIL